MRIVIDTNVIASSIFFGGKPRRLVELMMDGKLEAFMYQDIAEEYRKTVDYLKEKYGGKNIDFPLSYIVSNIKIIDKKSDVKICRDPDDDKFLNCALDAKAIYIVSGDKDLLSIGRFKNIEIVKVSDFLDRFY